MFSECFNAPKNTVFALKLVRVSVDTQQYSGIIDRHLYLDGWMQENRNSLLGFHVPNYNDVLSLLNDNDYCSWFDFRFTKDKNIRIALVELGGYVKENVNECYYVFKNMRIVRVYDDAINRENAIKRINQIKKAHRSIYYNKFSVESFNEKGY